ncbi:MAG: hypothetical protein EXR51_00005, partial [Dehalococcoidia bacterium]|nr:hypothetical protein [Dehalococcoidia bacterium]
MTPRCGTAARARRSALTGIRPRSRWTPRANSLPPWPRFRGMPQTMSRPWPWSAATDAATEVRVAETMADCAYGDGATRQAFADAQRSLVAKVPAMTNQGCFPKTAFIIDLAAGSCRCPAAQVSSDLRPRGKGGGVFRFPVEVCAECPLRAQCVRARRGRTVRVHPQEGLLQAARHLQASPAFAEYRRLRQVVEHRLARLVQLGIRQARYFGKAKTLFQLAMAAAVANLTLLAGSVRLDDATPSPLKSIGRLMASVMGLVLAVAVCWPSF